MAIKRLSEPNPASAVIYVRVSTEEQTIYGVSLDAQSDRLESYCKLAQLTPVAVLREEGVSGFKPIAGRPQGAILLDMARKKAIRHVVAIRLDRLFRSAIDALNTSTAWDKMGIALHLADAGGQAINTGSAMGRFFLTMMAAMAEMERNLIAERVTLSLAHKKRSGKAYSRTPFGFDKETIDQGENLPKIHNLHVNLEEMEIVKRMQAMRIAGKTYRDITGWLNDNHVVNKLGGKRWYPSGVRHLLLNDLYETISVDYYRLGSGPQTPHEEKINKGTI